MSARFDDLARQAMSLSREEKERLVRALIEELDASSDGTEEEVARLWAEEARRRHEEYLRGDVQAIPGDDALARARERLK
jgi:Putative addiction module component